MTTKHVTKLNKSRDPLPHLATLSNVSSMPKGKGKGKGKAKKGKGKAKGKGKKGTKGKKKG